MTRKIGRPKGSGKFTDDLANKIIRHLQGGMSLREVCKRKDIPVSHSTVLAWRDDRSLNVTTAEGVLLSFSDHYARAREDGYDMLFQQTLAIATECNATTADIAKARLITDILRWQLSKALPRYADRVNLEHTGADGGPIKSENIDPRDLARSVLDVLAEGADRAVEIELEALEAPETKH